MSIIYSRSSLKLSEYYDINRSLGHPGLSATLKSCVNLTEFIVDKPMEYSSYQHMKNELDAISPKLTITDAVPPPEPPKPAFDFDPKAMTGIDDMWG